MSSERSDSIEPRWPAIVAMIAVVGLRFVLPPALSIGPDWAMAPVVAGLLVPGIVLHQRGRHRANQIMGYILLAAVTADMIASLALLISRLPERLDTPRELLIA